MIKNNASWPSKRLASRGIWDLRPWRTLRPFGMLVLPAQEKEVGRERRTEGERAGANRRRTGRKLPNVWSH